jgi:hypothetical protein
MTRTEKTSNIVGNGSDSATKQTTEELRLSLGQFLFSGSFFKHLDHIFLRSTHHLRETQGKGREHGSCDNEVELHGDVQAR